MHATYYFLAHYCQELKPIILGAKIIDVYSSYQDEITLIFSQKGLNYNFKCNIGRTTNAFYLSQEEAHKPKSAYQSFFKEVIGKSVQKIVMVPFDRSFFIGFNTDEKLLFKLHGSRANLVLFNKKEEVSELFQKQHKTDNQLVLSDLQKASPTLPNLPFSLDELLLSNPFLGKDTQIELKNHLLPLNDIDNQLTDYQKFIDQISQKTCFYLSKDSSQLSWFDQPNGTTFTSAIEANNQLYKKLNYHQYFTLRKEAKLSNLKKEVIKLTKSIQKLETLRTCLEKPEEIKQKADVLMANLHLFTPSITQLEIHNFYTNTSLSIRLKQHQKPQELAHKWYKKSKSQHKEFEHFDQTIFKKKEQLTVWVKQLQEIESITEVKELNKHFKEEIKQQKDSIQSPFKQTQYQGFEILIGRNAKNNDELIKHVHKDDLWFHAKDVSGSHVVVIAKQKNIPISVIEHAASLAAYYSKRKTDSLCPVMFTQRKNVLKRKGFAAGMVHVSKETVILVPPKSLE
jgi:predicted ribosome quality control (RQC) complex YloA/Tae2 family protein